jgi:hypothetical protein
MGAILFRVLREERQRSDARVALLASAAAEFDLPIDLQAPAAASLATSEPVAARTDLFLAPEQPSPWLRRSAVTGVLAASVAIAGYALLQSGTGTESTAATAAAKNVPLELLTMRHTESRDGLTISGLVHNPRTGAAVSQIFVTAILFSPDGSFLTSGRAPVDFTTLAPGDESPFVITLPLSGAVARYRVGFRAADGTVIAHIDRRANGTSAGNASNSGSTPWAR